MTTVRHQGRQRITVFGGVFGVVMGLYIFLILGIVAADFLLVAGTPLGREQFWESVWNREDPKKSWEIWNAVWLTIWTSSVAAVISLLIAVPAGYLLSRKRRGLMKLLDAVVDIPIILPPLVFGISLLVLFMKSGMDSGLDKLGLRFVHRPIGIVLVQVLIATAYGTRMLKGTFDSIDPRMAAVAQTLGCSRDRAFFTVTLSEARSGIVAAFVMIWARATALYGPIIAFVGSTTNYTEVMPTRMYLEMSTGRLEAALVVALMMILLAVGVLLVVKLVAGRSADQVEQMTRV